MKNLMDHITIKRCHLILEGEDVLRALESINKHHRVDREVVVGNCGWADSPNKWFINFSTSVHKWRLIRNDLNVVRVFETLDIPNNEIGVVYSTT